MVRDLDSHSRRGCVRVGDQRRDEMQSGALSSKLGGNFRIELDVEARIRRPAFEQSLNVDDDRQGRDLA